MYKRQTEAMLDGAEMGLLYGLGDPYTYYYTPDQYAQLLSLIHI